MARMVYIGFDKKQILKTDYKNARFNFSKWKGWGGAVFACISIVGILGEYLLYDVKNYFRRKYPERNQSSSIDCHPIIYCI